MSASIVLRVKLGPFVTIEVTGDNCEEITEALDGYEALNKRIDNMCSDLVAHIYPEGLEEQGEEGGEAEEEQHKR